MTKMLICSAIALAGLAAGCAAPGERTNRPYRSTGYDTVYMDDDGRNDVVYVDSGSRPAAYGTNTVRTDSRGYGTSGNTVWVDTYSRPSYSQPSGPGTPNGSVSTPYQDDRWRNRWDGLTLGQRYQLERERGLVSPVGTSGSSSYGDGRYWDGTYWRLPDGRFWDGESWRR